MPSSAQEQEEADMPVWLEVLLNLSGYAGFVALRLARRRVSLACAPTSTSAATGASWRRAQLACAAWPAASHQPVGLDRDARVLELRPQREADHHESETEQRAGRSATRR